MSDTITTAELNRLHEIALLDHAADENAQRCYRAATIGDLREWLSPVPNAHPLLDTWAVNRRVDLMRRELARKAAAFCVRHDHLCDAGRFASHAEHVAEHLRELRGQRSA